LLLSSISIIILLRDYIYYIYILYFFQLFNSFYRVDVSIEASTLLSSDVQFVAHILRLLQAKFSRVNILLIRKIELSRVFYFKIVIQNVEVE